jgi:hypothetical protein
MTDHTNRTPFAPNPLAPVVIDLIDLARSRGIDAASQRELVQNLLAMLHELNVTLENERALRHSTLDENRRLRAENAELRAALGRRAA